MLVTRKLRLLPMLNSTERANVFEKTHHRRCRFLLALSSVGPADRKSRGPKALCGDSSPPGARIPRSREKPDPDSGISTASPRSVLSTSGMSRGRPLCAVPINP